MDRIKNLLRAVMDKYESQGLEGVRKAAEKRAEAKAVNLKERALILAGRFPPEAKAKTLGQEEINRLRDSGGMLRLHIGCGSKRLPGYVNVDKYPTSGADLTMDARSLGFPDESADEIFTSHMIEHLRPGEFDQAITEWRRVLKPGGLLRIRCPNFELCAREWLEGDYEWRWSWGIVNIFGHDNRGEGLLTRNGFTRDRLDRLLSENGFETLKCEVTATRPEFDGTIEYRPDGDLYYEGRRKEAVKVFYVDAISAPHAQSNLRGIAKAYRKRAILKTFDYRKLAADYGPFLMNRLLVKTAGEFRPDLVHIGKGESVEGRTVQRIKEETGAVAIHYYGDPPRPPTPYTADIGRYADLTLLYHQDPELIRLHHEAGIEHIGHWWAGVDPEVFYPRGGEKIYDLVFMASYYELYEGRRRREFVEYLLDAGFDLHLFGSNWEFLGKRPNLTVHDFVDLDAFAEICSRARIALGFDSSNTAYLYASWRRVFNSMACGAFHLRNNFPGLETVFSNGEHLVWFESLPEAAELVRYYLEHDAERERIAEAGRREVLARHTWDHRIQEMLEYMRSARERK